MINIIDGCWVRRGRLAAAALGAWMAWGGALSSVPAAAPAAEVRRDAVVEAVERALPSVVNIATRTQMRRQGFFYDWWRDNWAPFVQELPPLSSAGSGVIVEETGYVLTNSHVVEGADEITVVLSDGTECSAAVVKARPGADVALLKLRAPAGRRFPAATFAADDDLLLGETVLALGNPFGLGVSVSRGILSSKSRRPRPDDSGSLRLPDWLQTDAAINPGNSGGPLVNLRGEVIGINVAIYRTGQGIGFAIPIRQITAALVDLFSPEQVASLWFGARLHPGKAPMEVLAVEPGSPAENAGLRVGDLLVELDGEPVVRWIPLVERLVAAGDRHPVRLLIRRGGDTLALTLRLAPEDRFFNADLIRRRTGASVQWLTAALAESLGLNFSEGLLVAGVDADSPAARAGLQHGFVIQTLDGQPVTGLVNAARRLHARPAGETVALGIVIEEGNELFFRRRAGSVRLTLR